jgi:hypothetical protein
LNKDQRKAYRHHQRAGGAAAWYAYHIGYLLTLTLVKLSILVFYLSFATERTFRILVRACIITVSIISAGMILCMAIQCPKKPRFALTAGMFDNRGPIYCFDMRIVVYWQAAYNIASDLVILVLPLPLLYRLRMHKVKRLSILAVFSVGLLVPIASGIRFWGIYLWANSGKLSRYYGGYLIFWYAPVHLRADHCLPSCPGLKSKSTRP